MFKHILVSTDGSKLSSKAVKQAIEFAKEVGAKLTAVNVLGEYHLRVENEGFAMPEIPALRKRFLEAETARAKKILDAVKTSASEAGLDCNTVTPTSDSTYDAIIKQAKKSECDLIIMASHGRSGFQGMLLGSETIKVLTHSKIPVLVCR